jgi:type I restriction enzyme S subunit
VRSLWHLAGFVNGRAFKPDDFSPGGLPVIRIAQLQEASAELNYYDGYVDPANIIDDGDLVFSWSASLVVRIWDRGPAVLNQHLYKVMPSHDVDRRWLRWQLEALIPYFQGLMHGSAMTHLTTEMLRQTRVDLPNLERQRRIADFLDAETRKIAELTGRRSRQLGLLTERDQTALDCTLASEDDGLVALARTCVVQTGVTLDEGKRRENFVTRPYLRVANVQADGLLLDEVKEINVDPRDARRTTLQTGDVLMTEGGDLDKLGRGTVWNGEIDHCVHQNHVFAVRPDSRLSSDYLALLTRTSMARSYFEMTGSKTTNLASTSSSKILAFKVPLPSRQEQLGRVRAAHRALDASQRAAETLRDQLSLLAERRQALITAAVTGQLDVTTARSGVQP